MDEFTEVTSQGWLSRIKGAFGGIIFGLILTVVAFPVLFWNEGRAVKRHQTLQEGAANVVSIGADTFAPENDGRLVHLSGRTAVTGTISDEKFGITAEALKLRRGVEMYQWTESERSETKKKLGGGTETVTTYSYDKQWRGSLVNSDQFKKPAGHANPKSMPVQASEIVASPIALGAFTLPNFLVARIQNFVPVPAKPGESPLPDGAILHDGEFYFGSDPGTPKIGDARVKFAAVYPGDISLVAKQTGNTFEPYLSKAGGELSLLEDGVHSAEAMFQSAEQANRMMTWVLRIGGFLVMGIGLALIARPLSVVADAVPFIGNIVGAGAGFVAFVLAGIFSTTTIAVAWLFYRPLIGIAVLALTGALIWLLFGRVRQSRPAVADAPPPLG